MIVITLVEPIHKKGFKAMDSKYIKVKPIFSISSAFLFFFTFVLNPATAKSQFKLRPMVALEKAFFTVPDSIHTSVYWYWVSGNISKEGVIKDLEAMKKVGINRAFIAHVTWGEKNAGKIKMFSEEWWDILHCAFKTASALDIEIGVFNCPGWSQSGGPWVKPEQAMRYLTSSELLVEGPLLLHKKLEVPNRNFQDVKLIAYPAPKGYGDDLSNTKISAMPEIGDLNHLVDHNNNTIIHFPNSKRLTLDFSLNTITTLQSLAISTDQTPARLEGDIQTKVDKRYQTIKHFIIDRTNPNLKNGFVPFGPATIALPATTSKEFRLIFTDFSPDGGLAEIKFSSAPVIENYLEKTLAKMWPDGYVEWNAYQWLPQPVIKDQSYVINPDQVLDISKYMQADGTLNWQVAPGKWIIERTGMTPTRVQNLHATPEGTGLETDKMSGEHLYAHFDAFIGEIMRRIPAADRKSWKVVVVDSYETGSQNWTEQFITNFSKAYGYNPLPYLPVMQGKVVGSADQSDRFLWDLRRFVADQVAAQYVGQLSKLSHRYGLTTWLENYGHYGFPSEFLQYGGLADEVSGEFWNEGKKGIIENSAASSCAHIYGKTKVSAESFTTTDNYFMNYPATLKQRLDRSFTEGINNTLLHVYIHQPEQDKFPGMNAYFGTEFNRKNTWFYEMDGFVNYIKRCNLLLQQGKYVADVAYFISEDAPKMTGIQEPSLPSGYSFDYINADVIKNRLSVQNGKLILPDGMQYKILVLPKLESMRPELLAKIKDLVKDGAVVLGPKPLRSPSLQNFGKTDLDVQRMSAELWGEIDSSNVKINHYGKGIMIDGMNLDDAFKLIKVIPDFKVDQNDSLRYIHRKLSEGDIYFISNQKNQNVQFNPTFRVSGKRPELWNASTGLYRDLPDYKDSGHTINVPLFLAPYESAFVVFRKPIAIRQDQHQNYPKIQKTIMFNDPWLVQFDPGRAGPAKPVSFAQLTDWTQNTNDSIRYYSGVAYYSNSIQLPQINYGERLLLDLGKVVAIARVKVNGISLDGLWTAPYKIDITKAVRPGKNQLEIKVVNNWINRLVGDQLLKETSKLTWTYYGINPKLLKLQPSGLFGPVKLEYVK